MKDTINKIKIIGIGEMGINAVNNVIRNYDNYKSHIPKSLIKEMQENNYHTPTSSLERFFGLPIKAISTATQKSEEYLLKERSLMLLGYEPPKKSINYTAIGTSLSKALADTRLLKEDNSKVNTQIDIDLINMNNDIYMYKTNIEIDSLPIDDINTDMDNEQIKKLLNETDFLILTSEMKKEIDEKITLNITKIAKDLDISTIVIMPEPFKSSESKIPLFEENDISLIVTPNKNFSISENSSEETNILLEIGIETIINFILEKETFHIEDIDIDLQHLKFCTLRYCEGDEEMEFKALLESIDYTFTSEKNIEKIFAYVVYPSPDYFGRIKFALDIIGGIERPITIYACEEKNMQNKKFSITVLTNFSNYYFPTAYDQTRAFCKLLGKYPKEEDIRKHIESQHKVPLDFFKERRKFKKEIRMQKK